MSLQLHYQRLGNEKGQTLLFLHGLFGSGRNLYTLAKQFTDEYDIYLLDLRNHGQSPHHSAIDYHLMEEDISTFIERMNISHPILVGHSMGGKVSMVHALKKPITVKAMVVLDIAPIDYDIDYLPLIDALLSMELEQFQSRTDADKKLAEVYDNAVFRQFLLQNLIRSNGQFHWRLNLVSIRQHIEDIKSFPNLIDVCFDGPSLFLNGGDSDYVLPEHEERIHALFPSARMKSIANAGHWLQADQPEKVAQECRIFLNSLPNS